MASLLGFCTAAKQFLFIYLYNWTETATDKKKKKACIIEFLLFSYVYYNLYDFSTYFIINDVIAIIITTIQFRPNINIHLIISIMIIITNAIIIVVLRTIANLIMIFHSLY